MNDIAESGLALTGDNLYVAGKIPKIGLSNRTVIHKSYYSRYHAARSAAYLQMQLDVMEHRSLVNMFKKLPIRQFGDGTPARQMNNWRTERIKCDYDLSVEVVDVVCESAISDAVTIVDTCKNLSEEF